MKRKWWINSKPIFASAVDSVSSGFSSEDMARKHRMVGEETVAVEEVLANPEVRSVACYILPLENALTRWSVVHLRWHQIGGDCPLLTAFLAGWCCRCVGTSIPQNLGQFRDSFWAGWREADETITIETRRVVLSTEHSKGQKE